MTGEFHKACRSLAAFIVYSMPPEETDKYQPMDQGEGNLINILMDGQMDIFLQKHDNLEKWHTKITASNRKTLINQIVRRSMRETWQGIP